MRIWSLDNAPGSFCGFALVPVATADWGKKILDVDGVDPVWGWTPPGVGDFWEGDADLRLAERYKLRTIADVELRQWKGRAGEATAARALADLCGGVTSHGFVAPPLEDSLREFADRDRIAYPQVYDTDRSTPVDGSFIAACVQSYRKIGFARVVPLLGASAGPERLAAWAAWCRTEGVDFDFWELSDARQLGCDALAELAAGSPIPLDGSSSGSSSSGSSSSGRSSIFLPALGIAALAAAAFGAAIGWSKGRAPVGLPPPRVLAEMNLSELRAAYRAATGRPPPPAWGRPEILAELGRM